MNKIEEILKSKGITYSTKFHNYEYLYKVIQESMIEFGRLAFDAGRENKTKYNPTKDGKLYQMYVIPEYKTYEDFLKENKDE